MRVLPGRSGGRRHGQALVEFALILPVFLLIIFGVFDAGRLIFTYNTISNASRSAARVAIVNQSTAGTNTCDTTQATAFAEGCALVAGAAIGTASADVQIDYKTADGAASCPNPKYIGCLAVVQVTGHFQALTPIIGQIIGPTTVTSTTTMPIERVCPPSAPAPNC
jgi:Flp pilus assembly protein TadG